MKTLLRLIVILVVLAAQAATAQGTAFTYQGLLQSGNNLAGGQYDLVFSLYPTSIGGSAVAGPVTNSAVNVTNGLFATTVNFGNIFAGASNWMEIAVSTNGANTFITLSPRQQLTPAPYALYAETADAAGLTGVLSGDGSGLTNLSASQLETGTVPAAQLPPPTATTIGGIVSTSAVTSQWVNSIGTDGRPTLAQPAFSDISSLIGYQQLPNAVLTNNESQATSLQNILITSTNIVTTNGVMVPYATGLTTTFQHGSNIVWVDATQPIVRASWGGANIYIGGVTNSQPGLTPAGGCTIFIHCTNAFTISFTNSFDLHGLQTSNGIPVGTSNGWYVITCQPFGTNAAPSTIPLAVDTPNE